MKTLFCIIAALFLLNEAIGTNVQQGRGLTEFFAEKFAHILNGTELSASVSLSSDDYVPPSSDISYSSSFSESIADETVCRCHPASDCGGMDTCITYGTCFISGLPIKDMLYLGCLDRISASIFCEPDKYMDMNCCNGDFCNDLPLPG
ncbi:uncharacterized protein LOC144435927 [Glandiceps talaboti]